MTTDSVRCLGQSDIDNMEQRFRANFINSLSGFKSANLLGTRSQHNIDNLCIVSSVFHVGANPPLLGMLMRPHTVVRDSLENIKRTGEFTLNHVHHDFIGEAHQSSARYPSDTSEFEAVGLTPEHCQVIDAPYVKESEIKLALKAVQIQKIELNNTQLVIGQVVEVKLPQEYMSDDGYVDIEKAKTACISGLDSYHRCERLDRFDYAKPDEPTTSILSYTRSNG